jgi:hypothetical protein
MDNRLFPPYTKKKKKKKKKNLKDQTHKLFFTVPILGLFPFGPDTLGYIGPVNPLCFWFFPFQNKLSFNQINEKIY